MFNNLGLLSPQKPVLKRSRRVPIAPVAQYGGPGNDFFLTGTLNVPGGQGPAGPTGPTGPIGPTGATGPTGPAGLVGIVPVTQVTTSTFTASSTDYFLCVDVSSTTTITLPIGILGTVYIVKDCSGSAPLNPITVQGTSGQLIDGSLTATINSSYGSVTFVFNGTEWSIA